MNCGGAAVVSEANLGSVEVALVKAAAAGSRDRVYLEVEGEVRRVPVHVVHDLPHLVVESLFGIGDGLWGELAAGLHAGSGRAATARDPKRNKLGRIVSGDAAGARTDDWLTAGHRVAKTVTNCVANRWGDGPDTPAGVRARIAREGGVAEQELLGRVDDETVALAIEAVREFGQRWAPVPPGGTLRLWWPLPANFFLSVGSRRLSRSAVAPLVLLQAEGTRSIPQPRTVVPIGRSLGKEPQRTHCTNAAKRHYERRVSSTSETRQIGT